VKRSTPIGKISILKEGKMKVALKMKVVLNMKEFQLLGLLEALGGGTARVENIVINAKEIDTKEEGFKKEEGEEFKREEEEEFKEEQKEEFKKEHRDLTTEDLMRIQEAMNQDGNGKDVISKKVPGIEE